MRNTIITLTALFALACAPKVQPARVVVDEPTYGLAPNRPQPAETALRVPVTIQFMGGTSGDFKTPEEEDKGRAAPPDADEASVESSPATLAHHPRIGDRPQPLSQLEIPTDCPPEGKYGVLSVPTESPAEECSAAYKSCCTYICEEEQGTGLIGVFAYTLQDKENEALFSNRLPSKDMYTDTCGCACMPKAEPEDIQLGQP